MADVDRGRERRSERRADDRSRAIGEQHGVGPEQVLAANGSPVYNAEELRSAVEKSKGHVALLIQRGDARMFVPVRVG